MSQAFFDLSEGPNTLILVRVICYQSLSSCWEPDISITQCKIPRGLWSHFTYASVFSDNGMFNVELGNVLCNID